MPVNSEEYVFIDSEFCPISRRWLSTGAIIRQEMFYAATRDQAVLQIAEREFAGNPVRDEVLGQIAIYVCPPGAVDDLAQMAWAFRDWIKRVGSDRDVYVCYDYSLDIELLEQGFEDARLVWPETWHPCSLAILNEDTSSEVARLRVWSEFEQRHGIRRHHALADAATLQAAYCAQSKGPG